MVQQISVFIQNKPGRLAELTGALAKGGVDVRALSIADTTDFGILRLLVDNAALAKNILEKQKYAVGLTPVTVVAVPDVPGGLAGVLALLAEGGVDIEYMYSLIGRGEDKAYMVFRVSDGEKLLSLLGKKGISTVSKEELGIR
jgi:hypothetical protein